MGVKKPLEDLSPSLAERIVQTLLDSRAETVQRNTKSCDPDFLHISISPDFRTGWLPLGGAGAIARRACDAFRFPRSFGSDRRLAESPRAHIANPDAAR